MLPIDTSIEIPRRGHERRRRLHAVGPVRLCLDCWLHTSARRFNAMGKAAVFRLYVRKFLSEILYHRPTDTTHQDIRGV